MLGTSWFNSVELFLLLLSVAKINNKNVSIRTLKKEKIVLKTMFRIKTILLVVLAVFMWLYKGDS